MPCYFSPQESLTGIHKLFWVLITSYEDWKARLERAYFSKVQIGKVTMCVCAFCNSWNVLFLECAWNGMIPELNFFLDQRGYDLHQYQFMYVKHRCPNTSLSIFRQTTSSETTKGQLISKCLFGVLNSPKKWTKTIWLGTIVVKTNFFFVHFLGLLKIQNIHFEINWPVV